MPNPFKSPFTSRRVERLPDPDAPTPFQQTGGWATAGEAAAASAQLDPSESERDQRRAGAVALAALEAQRQTERAAAMDARLAGVERGRTFTEHLSA